MTSQMTHHQMLSTPQQQYKIAIIYKKNTHYIIKIGQNMMTKHKHKKCHDMIKDVPQNEVTMKTHYNYKLIIISRWANVIFHILFYEYYLIS
jgi:hypothetical protein